MLHVKTIGQDFSLDLDLLKQHIEQEYGFTILQPLGDVLRGDVNINFALETSAGKKLVRMYGAFSQFTQAELEIMLYLVDQRFPTSRPLTNKVGQLVSRFEGYEYSIFDFLDGARPLFTPEAFHRIGKSTARMQQELRDCPVKLTRENRFVEIYKRKDKLGTYITDHMDIAHDILKPEVFATLPKQLELLDRAYLPDTDEQLIHGDIYTANIIDNGTSAAIIDFEWIARGPAVIDQLLLAAWESVCNSRAQNTPAVYRPEPYLMIDLMRAYFEGYKTAGTLHGLQDPHIIDTLIFLSVGDNLFNLEIAIKAGYNLFQDYLNSYNSAIVIDQNRRQIQSLFAELAD